MLQLGGVISIDLEMISLSGNTLIVSLTQSLFNFKFLMTIYELKFQRYLYIPEDEL